ncbi:hypothetical protein VUR80DRAFT_8941 [Thermomyces stellatus]
MARIQLFVLLLGVLLSLAAASSPQTFCKCTCFKNSTIIPLSENPESSRRSAPLLPELDRRDTHLAKRVPAACSACTRTFCRSHKLPFCHDATDDDITTSCFQRDSPTDRLIVWGFILGVLGLLGWAAFKKVRSARAAREVRGAGGTSGMFSRGRSGGGAYSPLRQGR